MKQLLKDQEAVNEVRSIVLEEEEKMSKETDLVSEYATEAQKDLDGVLSELETAKESLETLRKADISEIKYFSNSHSNGA
jgi:dynein heavy chain